MEKIIVEKELCNIRLDQFITSKFLRYSRSYFKKIIEDGLVFVNKKNIKKAGFELKENDIVEFEFPKININTEFDNLEIDNLKIEIVFSCKDFMIINKPAGVLMHPASKKHNVISLVNWIKRESLTGYDQTDERPGIVHRLDRDTSGLLIVSLSNFAHKEFEMIFKNRSIKKTYFAIVCGHPEKTGFIDLAISRHKTVRNRMAHNIDGRKSLTNYEVVEYFKEHSLVKVQPTTGRTHQIRVHFSTIGHPLLGDALYGKESKLIKRHALHASNLEFNYQAENYKFFKDFPDDLNDVILKLKSN